MSQNNIMEKAYHISRMGYAVKKMVLFKNTPFGEQRLKSLEECLEEDKCKYVTPCGYISGYRLERDSLTLLVIIDDGFDDGIVIEAKYSTRAGENSELLSLLEDFHCLYEDAVDFRGFFNYMGVDILFEYNEVCRAYFAKKISTNPIHSTFSGELGTKELERIMYATYREEEKKKGRHWR